MIPEPFDKNNVVLCLIRSMAESKPWQGARDQGRSGMCWVQRLCWLLGLSLLLSAFPPARCRDVQEKILTNLRCPVQVAPGCNKARALLAASLSHCRGRFAFEPSFGEQRAQWEQLHISDRAVPLPELSPGHWALNEHPNLIPGGGRTVPAWQFYSEGSCGKSSVWARFEKERSQSLWKYFLSGKVSQGAWGEAQFSPNAQLGGNNLHDIHSPHFSWGFVPLAALESGRSRRQLCVQIRGAKPPCWGFLLYHLRWI